MYKPAIAFFGFNRPDCTKVVFEEIRRYRPEKLFLVADGPRAAVSADKQRCEAVREIMRSVDWECDVRTNFSPNNLGCRARMASGIDWVFSQIEEVIFLEDDCVPSPDFFNFCSEMLTRYRDQPKIMIISGTNVQRGQRRGEASYYFSRQVHIWGWASWKRAWKFYDVAMSSWPEAREKKWIKTICPPVEGRYWTEKFDQTYDGTLNTWDYQWTYSVWRSGGMAIVPNANLITNIGGGPDATHTTGPMMSLGMATGNLNELTHPKAIVVDKEADDFAFLEDLGENWLKTDKLLIRLRHGMKPFIQKLFRATGLVITRSEGAAKGDAPGMLKVGPYHISRR